MFSNVAYFLYHYGLHLVFGINNKFLLIIIFSEICNADTVCFLGLSY
jgi:hypothetical protein